VANDYPTVDAGLLFCMTV